MNRRHDHTASQGDTPLPAQVKTLADHHTLAHSRLHPAIWAYFHGGAADEITLRANAQAWADLRLQARVMRPLAGAHIQVQVGPHTWPCPLMVAPMAYQTLAHPLGEVATALAASAQGAGMVLSTQAGTRLEDVAHAVRQDPGRGPLWFQLYLQPDRTITLDLVARAEAAGFEALVLTVDAPVHGARDRERQSGFKLPVGVRAVNLPAHQSAHVGHGDEASLQDLLAAAPGWDDLAWLRSITRLPIWLKGITHPADAELAVQHGAAGLIVSNHGGRTLDTLPPTAQLLPAIVQQVQGRLPVLVDGGIRRGTDILKALALGAQAVMVGRPVLDGLVCGGAHGVAHVLRLLKDELLMAMALTGCPTPADIHAGLLAHA